MLLKYKCGACGNEIKKLIADNNNVPGFIQCECGGILEKELPEFAMNSYETIDNGNMAKRVTFRRDALQKSKEKGDNYIKTMETRDKVDKKDG